MRKNRKIILVITGFALFSILSFAAFVFISNSSIRNQIPEKPDLKTISKQVQKQISEAHLKALIHPSAANLGNLGMVYNSCAYQEKAAQCFKIASQKGGKQWIWDYYLGYINLEQGDSKASIENFKRVIQRNPGNYLALYYTGEAYQNMGLTANSEGIFNSIARIRNSLYEKTNRDNYFPLQTYAMFRLGRIYMNTNRLDSAELILKDLITQQWTFGPAYRLLGNVYIKKGDAQLGNKYITRAGDFSEFTPPQDTLMDRMALISRSDKYLLKVIEDAKTSFNFNWGLKLCNHALKFLPEDKYLISNYILINFILQKNADALPFLDQHLINFSQDYDELMKIADILYNKGYPTQAMKFFEQARKIQPMNSMLSIWLSQRGKDREAIALINEQLKKEPGNEKILTDAAHIYLKVGNREMVTKCLTILQKRYPSNLEVKKIMGLMLESEGKHEEALSIYGEISEGGLKDLAIHKYLYAIYAQNNMWDKAISNVRIGLANFPNDPDLLEGLSRILIFCPDKKMRNIEEGREYAERAYINYQTPPAVKLAAAKDLSTAYAMLGDKSRARFFINVAMDIVQRGNYPPNEYLSYFDILSKEYSL